MGVYLVLPQDLFPRVFRGALVQLFSPRWAHCSYFQASGNCWSRYLLRFEPTQRRQSECSWHREWSHNADKIRGKSSYVCVPRGEILGRIVSPLNIFCHGRHINSYAGNESLPFTGFLCPLFSIGVIPTWLPTLYTVANLWIEIHLEISDHSSSSSTIPLESFTRRAFLR